MKVKFGEPILLETSGTYNIVTWRDLFYALPQSLGAIDLRVDKVREFPGILIGESVESLKEKIIHQQASRAVHASLPRPRNAVLYEILQRIRTSIRPGTPSVAFFCPTKAFRKQFGKIPALLEKAGYSVLYLYQEIHRDEYESHPTSFFAGGPILRELDFLDVFIVPTIMDCLPPRPKKILFPHNSFAGFEFPAENEEKAIGIEGTAPSYPELVERYRHQIAFFSIFDYFFVASPVVAEYYRSIARFYGKTPVSSREGKNAEDPGRSPDAAALLEGLKGQRLARETGIVPLGYPPLDANIRFVSSRRNYERIITYAPTPIAGKPYWMEYASVHTAGKEILFALLQAFPQHQIVFKPHADELPDVVSHIARDCARFPNFVYDRSGGEYMDLYSRTAVLISDFSGTAYTFAFSCLRPVVFFSRNERTLPQVVRGNDFCKNRSTIGAVACEPGELVEKTDYLLKHIPDFSEKIRNLRDASIYHVGGSDEYFVKNFPYVISQRKNPEWEYLTECQEDSSATSKVSVRKQTCVSDRISGREQEKRYFLITSMGCAATRWLAATLNRHPEIVCSGGAGELSEVMAYGKRPDGEQVDRIAEFLLNHYARPDARPKSVDEMFDELETYRKTDYYGNVHRETMASFHHLISRIPVKRKLKIANLIRHPIPRTEAKFNNERFNDASSAKARELCHLQYLGRAEAHRPFIDLLHARIGPFEEIKERYLFVNSLIDTVGGLTDFARYSSPYEIPHVRMEDLKSKPECFRSLVRYLTSGRLIVSADYLDMVYSADNLNRERFRTDHLALIPPRTPEEQWEAWEDWQRRAFQAAVEMYRFQEAFMAQGYDFAFMKRTCGPAMLPPKNTREGTMRQNRAEGSKQRKEREFQIVSTKDKPHPTREYFTPEESTMRPETIPELTSMPEKRTELWNASFLETKSRAEERRLPHVIFCNLICSGSSALDPIFRELLEPMGYCILPFGPEATNRLSEFVHSESPIYHWSHDPLQTFHDLGVTGREDYKFIYLHRDLRNVAVSWTKDGLGQNIFPGKTEREALETVITHMLPPHAVNACEWIAYSKDEPAQCLTIRFDEMKNEMRAVLERIFDFLDIHPADEAIEASIHKHSFEAITGRRRGEEGPPIRTGYFLRKGISGEWKRHLDADLREKFKLCMGRALVETGWEKTFTWGPREIQIVSAPFSCGVAWLINVLLELGIRTTNQAFMADHWTNHESHVEMGPKSYNHLRWHLPVLQERKEFFFHPDLEVLWEHRLDFARHPERPTILYVRDPRDAIYSLYCRNYAKELTFIDYLRRPDVWPDHFPGMFSLPPAETWAYFNLFWLAMREAMNIHIVRFEDMRADPVRVTGEILRFIGVKAEEKDVCRALERSTFEKARSAMENTARQTGESFQTARRGKIGEWREVYNPDELACFSGPAQYCMEQLGYCASRQDHRLDIHSSSAPANSLPSAHPVVEQAISLFQKGDRETAEKLLWGALAEDSGSSCLTLRSSLRALEWTNAIFSDRELNTPQAGQAFHLFKSLNERFASSSSIRRMLEKISSKRSGVKNEICADLAGELPRLVEEGYKGFNIVRYGKSYVGLAQCLGPVDLTDLDEQKFRDYQGRGKCVVGSSREDVRSLIDQIARGNGQVMNIMAIGKMALERGDYRTAVREFGQLAHDFPDHPHPQFFLGVSLLRLGHFPQAVWALRQARDQAPQEAAIHNNLGIALYKMGDGKEAEKSFQSAIRVDPGNVDARVSLAEVFCNRGLLAPAAAYLKEAAVLAPNDVEVLAALGTLAVKLGDREAMGCALKIQEIDPAHPMSEILQKSLRQVLTENEREL